jgi:hypothetical protein
MPRFRAVVQFADVVAPDVLAAREALESRLREAKIPGTWGVLDVAPDSAAPSREPPTVPRYQNYSMVGKVLLIAAAGWALWFFWLLAE